ncbi:hypothetical protein IQ06DRAFT_293188 [Phaeosphaeriaceae sp. SRC1lsM3a]|nr:hypothetical protein IQ06DRAFT_293188 [Stagonospora sp. SRC1lsM3a]
MSSYGSNHSGYLHPSQYPPNPPAQQQQQQHPQPPYPTTPGPAPGQQSAFYPPAPQNQQQMYSTSPASPWQTPNYSSSAPQYPFYSSSPGSAPPQPMQQHHRRSSSMSQNGRPQFSNGTAPIAIPQQQQPYGFGQQGYAHSHGSHGSQHSHHHHHGHDGHGEDEQWGVLDEETLRSYEKRYAKERKLEKRPTLGGSVMSMVRALSGKRE